MRKSVFVAWALVAGVAWGADPQMTFKVTGGEGRQGQKVASRVLITTDTELQGWSFGIRWDSALLSLASSERGVVLNTVNGGNPADFISIEGNPVNGPGLTEGVVVSFMQTAALPVGTDYEVLKFELNIDGSPEGDEPLTTELQFADDLGSPAVATVVVIGGSSIPPQKENGTITIQPPPKDCKIENFACETDPDNAFLTWNYIGCEGEHPFEFLLLYRERMLLAELDLATTKYDDLGLEPGTYTYTIAWVYWPASGDPITLEYVQCTAQVIALMVTDVTPTIAFLPGTVPNPAQSGDFIPGVLTVTGRGFRDGLTPENEPVSQVFIGGVRAPTLEVVGDHTITASIPCSSVLGTFDVRVVVEGRGEITVPAAFTYGWLRADVDINGKIELQDAIIVLEYLFLNRPEPYCMDAADANDDGNIDIADGVFLIYMAALVDPAAYTPKEPWTTPLVVDPTKDSLGCKLEGFTCTQGR